MRFSATASFSAWVVLLRLGRLTPRSALVSPLVSPLFSHQRRDWPFASIWLTLRTAAPLLNSGMTHLHSFFSHGLWPVVLPMGVLLMEPAGWRRRALVAPCASGAAAKLAVEAPA